MSEVTASNLIALICRATKGCRQYAFCDVESIAKFVGRKPYSGEYMNVIPVRDRNPLPDSGYIQASEVVAFVKQSLEKATT